MYYEKFQKHDDAEDYVIYIRESYSIKGKKYKRTLEKYDSSKELTIQYGDWEAFINNRIEILKHEKNELKNNNKLIELNFDVPLVEKETNDIQNAGYLFLQKIYYKLGLDQFFYHIKNNNNLKINYSLNDAVRLLTYSRIIKPNSKKKTLENSSIYLEDFDLSYDDILDSLDRLNDYKDKLQEYAYKNASKLLPPSNNVIYYDVTNFYYEIEEENEIAAYGIEKNHRPDPITSFGLFMDNNGLPMRYAAYRGNESEKTNMLPIWKKMERYLEEDKSYIVCADAGLNTSDIKFYLTSKNDHYIFSQSVKMLDDDTLKMVFNDENWITLNDEVKYKVRKLAKDSYIHSKHSKRKDGKIKVEIDTKYIIFLDEKRRRYLLNKIEERYQEALNIIAHPSKYDKTNSQNGKQYIKKLVFDEDGTLIEKESKLIIDTEIYEKEKKFAGYGGIVTDLFNTSEEEIITISKGRWEIEDCFRQMKSSIETRPVYVSTPNHIHGHFMSCYLALSVIKLLEKLYFSHLTADEIFETIRNYSLTKLNNDRDYRTSRYNLNTLQMMDAFDFQELKYKDIPYINIKKIISKSKKK